MISRNETGKIFKRKRTNIYDEKKFRKKKRGENEKSRKAEKGKMWKKNIDVNKDLRNKKNCKTAGNGRKGWSCQKESVGWQNKTLKRKTSISKSKWFVYSNYRFKILKKKKKTGKH